MDFVEAPFGGEGVEVPLVGLTVIGPDTEWSEYCKQSLFVDADGNLDLTRSEEEIAGFIQSWLYFGLISVLGDTIIDGQDFSTAGKSWPTVVDSKLIASALIDIKLRLLRLPNDSRKPILQRQTALLIKADDAVRWTEDQLTSRPNGLVDLILLSVKVLIGTIARSYDHVGGRSRLLDNPEVYLLWYDVAQRRSDQLRAASRALKTKMMENGWCIHQIHKILSRFDYQTAYFFARLPRPISARLGHERCTHNSCKGWDSKPGDTRARHEKTNCTCPTISVPSAEVARIIQSNCIPLVSVEEDLHGDLSLKLHTMKRYAKRGSCSFKAEFVMSQ
jgi:hypothetical protein